MDEQCDVCPYCRGIPGVGPNPVTVPRTPFDEVLYETNQVVLTPSLGMIVPGCFLIVSKEHLYSYAEFSRQSLIELNPQVNKIIEWLEPQFDEYMLFEHGASRSQSESHGGCITHAHFHLFPTARVVGPRVLDSLPWERLVSFSALSEAEGETYALLGLRSEYYLSKSPKLPSQWIRRMVVESLDTTKHWDWGVEFGLDELKETLAKLKRSS